MRRRVEKLSVAAAVIVLALVAVLPSTGGAQQGDDADSVARTASAAPSLPLVRHDGLRSEGARVMGEEEAADRDWPVKCDFATAVRSAGDVVTWVNPTDMTMAIQAGDDQFSTEDMSSAFSSLEVAAHGQVMVRLIHAGLIEYNAPDHPGISGTILVLGRGAA